MNLTPLEHRITEIVQPVIADLGFQLVQVRMNNEVVQIMAENPETKNLGIEDCTKISRAVSATLDVEDPIKGAYRLEISSPGIDRPLVRLEDFETYNGYDVKLETKMPTESGQKRFRGIIKGLNKNTIEIETDEGTAHIDFEMLSKAKLVLSDELIKKAKAN